MEWAFWSIVELRKSDLQNTEPNVGDGSDFAAWQKRLEFGQWCEARSRLGDRSRACPRQWCHRLRGQPKKVVRTLDTDSSLIFELVNKRTVDIEYAFTTSDMRQSPYKACLAALTLLKLISTRESASCSRKPLRLPRFFCLDLERNFLKARRRFAFSGL